MSDIEIADNSSRPVRGRPFQKGNPGKPLGAKDKLARNFGRVLANDFKEHGFKAVIKCREENPAAYLKVVADFVKKDAEGFGGPTINILIQGVDERL